MVLPSKPHLSGCRFFLRKCGRWWRGGGDAIGARRTVRALRGDMRDEAVFALQSVFERILTFIWSLWLPQHNWCQNTALNMSTPCYAHSLTPMYYQCSQEPHLSRRSYVTRNVHPAQINRCFSNCGPYLWCRVSKYYDVLSCLLGSHISAIIIVQYPQLKTAGDYATSGWWWRIAYENPNPNPNPNPACMCGACYTAQLTKGDR